MNVLLVAPWDNIGGVCNVVNRVAQHMRGQGHGVHFLLPGATNELAPGTSREGFSAFRMYLRATSIEGSGIRSRVAFAAYFPVALMRLDALLRREKIDVVNVHYPSSASIYFSWLRRLGRIRLVTSIHGADLLPNGVRASDAGHGIGSLLACSDVIVAPSNAYQRAASEAWPELEGRRTQTIPNGIDPSELGYDAARNETADEAPYVLSILQLVRYKGVDVLIRAFAKIAANRPTLRLKLISDGPNRADFEALARELGVADRVDFLGFVDRTTVARYLRGCSLFVLPSRSNSESFGISAAEAMAVDRPVIASRVGGLPELIEDGATGLLVAPGDPAELERAMRRVLDDPAFAAGLGTRAGVAVRSRFLWKRCSVLYEDVFRSVVESPATAGEPAPAIPAVEAVYPTSTRAPAPPAQRSNTTLSVTMSQDRL